MRKLNLILECVTDKIKKKFFKVENNDISHVCNELNNGAKNGSSIEELKQIDEYILKYTTTTRWQTI